MANNEATARIKINKLLEKAGWKFFPEERQTVTVRLESWDNLSRVYIPCCGVCPWV